MARKKPASRAAAKTAARKTTAARKAAGKSSARKTIASKGRAPKAAKPARRKQRIAISHHREEDFKADGLRAYAHYRDLGIRDATGGLAQAHVVRLVFHPDAAGDHSRTITVVTDTGDEGEIIIQVRGRAKKD